MPITALWLSVSPLLVAMGQAPEVAAGAARCEDGSMQGHAPTCICRNVHPLICLPICTSLCEVDVLDALNQGHDLPGLDGMLSMTLACYYPMRPVHAHTLTLALGSTWTTPSQPHTLYTQATCHTTHELHTLGCML